MPHSPIALLGAALLLATFAFALWKGDAAERIGGAMNMGAGLFAMFLHPLLNADLQPIAMLVVDATLAAGFLFLAIRFASLWLGAAMIFQAVQFSLHAFYMVSETPTGGDLTYARINNFDTTAINVVIIIGTVISLRRRNRVRREAERKAAEAAATAKPAQPA